MLTTVHGLGKYALFSIHLHDVIVRQSFILREMCILPCMYISIMFVHGCMNCTDMNTVTCDVVFVRFCGMCVSATVYWCEVTSHTKGCSPYFINFVTYTGR